MAKDPTNKPKIVKINKNIQKKIELTEDQLTIKQKFIDIDNKIDDLENILNSICEDNPNTIFQDETIHNIVGLTALASATKLIGQYFGMDDLKLNELL